MTQQTTIDIPSEVNPQAVAVRELDQAMAPALPPEQIRPPMTPAQAKVDAIANLTMSAYAKAGTLQFTREEIDALAADFPDEAFQPGAAGKEHLIYIEHAHLRDRLNQVFGPGQWAIVPRSRWAEPFKTSRGDDGSRVYVEAMLIIRGAFVAEAIGAMEYYPKNAAQNYGDACEGAKTAALRRCAKELGIGLQAWKKEWCEGWWARKRAGRQTTHGKAQPQAPPPRPATNSAPTGSRQPPASPASPASPGANAGPATPKEAIFADAATRDRMIQGFGDEHAIALEYFRKLENPAVLMPNEQLTDLPLQWVPVTKRQFETLHTRIGQFAAGDPAMHPYPPNPLPPAAKPEKAKAVEVPRDKPGMPPEGADYTQEPWFDAIVPIPRKGMKRDEYLRNPDTIGSLYEARHADEDASRRLFGFAYNFEPKGWQKTNGDQMPPSAADNKFRADLDAFLDYFKKTHPEEVRE